MHIEPQFGIGPQEAATTPVAATPSSQWVIATPSSQYFRLKIILCQKLATRASPTLFCDETSQLLAGNLEIRV